ncbi:carbonic anhydrase 7-like [Octopus sinensis]|uniref:Carbonic anhydrase n=1 Tax=Octopus sinensis TaxID=2607531 RepID=A0A7E6F8H5_9MOLL|nr:carbonic anhydrase 7-like [Octopus sinensis]
MEKKTFRMLYLMATFSAKLFVHLVSAWDYHNESKYWVKQYPDCGGKLQSPVAIEHKLTSYKESKDLLFEGYVDIMHNVTLKNIGHTVAIEVKSEGIVSGGELDGRYIAHQVHFHWGMNDIVGSEHMLNGKRYPMEVHILHYAENYHNFQKASRQKHGLLIVAYFVATSNTYEDNEGFADIVENVKMINFKGNTHTVSSWKLEEFAPINQTCYYFYDGSLTYPPCWETVMWIVYKDPLEISKRQMNEFRTNLAERDVTSVRIMMGNNFRPLQHLNDRIIYRSCDPLKSDMTSLSWSAVLLMLCQVGIFMNNSCFWYLVPHKYRPTEC